MANNLTTRQRQVLRFLEANPAASYRQIAAHLGSPNVGAAEHHIVALERKGYVLRGARYGLQLLITETGEDLRTARRAA